MTFRDYLYIAAVALAGFAFVVTALGGPTASFTYDSYRDRLTFNYSWASESLSVDVDTDAGAGADVAQLIRDYAEA